MNRCRLCLILLLALAPLGFAEESANGLLSPGDVVYINVFRHPELSASNAVDANGMVDVPHAGKVNIAGKSESEASSLVQEALKVVLKNPRVTLSRSASAMPAMPVVGNRKPEMRTQVVEVRNARAENIYNALSGMATEGGSISFDEATNTVIITDEPETLQNMIGVVNQLDNLENQMAQVHIEARIAEIESSAIKEVGLRWFAQGDHLSGGYIPNPRQDARVDALRTFSDPLFNERINSESNGGNNFGNNSGREFVDGANFDRRMQIPVQVAAPGQMFLGFLNAGIDLGAMLDALVADNDAELLATPYIRAVNHETAEIKMAQEFPYVELNTTGLTTISATKFIDIGITLQVTPHIRQDPDGAPYVQLELEPEVSTVTGVANGVPVRSVRRSSSTANVRDGQTLVIGGIMQNDNRHVVQKVPGLGNLPLFGTLFKHKENSDTNRELMIFVTPKIYAKPEAATWQYDPAAKQQGASNLLQSLEARGAAPAAAPAGGTE